MLRSWTLQVGDAAAAFHMNTVLPMAHYSGKVLPTDVVSICKLTWMCPDRSQQGQDIHPNLAGYRTIAGAFKQKLGS